MAIYLIRTAEANGLPFHRVVADRSYMMWVDPVVPWPDELTAPQEFTESHRKCGTDKGDGLLLWPESYWKEERLYRYGFRHDQCRDMKRGQDRLERLADLRAEGNDPAHGGTAATQRGETNRTHQTAVTKWNSENEKPRPEIFATQILPGLQKVSINQMVEATGLTPGYCSFIRRGIKTPHPRHWTAFERLDGKTTS